MASLVSSPASLMSSKTRAWTSDIISCSGLLVPGTSWLCEDRDGQEKRFDTYTESNFYTQEGPPRWFTSIFYSWEHSWNEIRLNVQCFWAAGTRRKTCHLNWVSFWMQQQIGCSLSLCQSHRGRLLLYWPISWQKIGTRFPRSASRSRCAAFLFSVITSQTQLLAVPLE